jgi:mediator of RNA polymerase II transcription subunit 5
MTTSAQGLTQFASTLVQQAVVAAMSGQLDLDTLYSGLSYYAQPLLSWCLGGVVGWLCAEIERQGALSGMHLKVLQTLVLDTAFPEPLLRANAQAIIHLLEPATGLQPVMQSSGFDHVGVRSRLQSVDSLDGPAPIPEAILLAPLPVLRNELQAVRHLHLSAPGWEARVLDCLGAALRVHGPLKTL